MEIVLSYSPKTVFYVQLGFKSRKNGGKIIGAMIIFSGGTEMS